MHRHRQESHDDTRSSRSSASSAPFCEARLDEGAQHGGAHDEARAALLPEAERVPLIAVHAEPVMVYGIVVATIKDHETAQLSAKVKVVILTHDLSSAPLRPLRVRTAAAAAAAGGGDGGGGANDGAVAPFLSQRWCCCCCWFGRTGVGSQG